MSNQISNPKTTYYPGVVVSGKGNLQKSINSSLQLAKSLTKKQFIEYIEPENNKKIISVEQIRVLRKKISLKNSIAYRRVIIIKDAGKLGVEGQNMLLKMLEEGSENSTIILAVKNTNELLTTLLSRCAIIQDDNTPDIKSDKKQFHIDSALYEHRITTDISDVDIEETTRFLQSSVADRLHYFSEMTDNRQKLVRFLVTLRVICISTMRNVPKHEAKIAWLHKVSIVNDLINKAESNTSGKLLLLAASTLL